MRSLSLIVAVSAALGVTQAFTSPAVSTSRLSLTRAYGYVPQGFTAASWAAQKKKDAAQSAKKKNLGGMGPRGFKSRSFQSFQEALEKGEASHMMPVMFAEERVKKGEIKREDIPYMQRGGSWDNSDVKGAKKVKWLNSDTAYAGGGFKKEQSVSVFGKGAGLDWTGMQGRTGPSETIPGAAPKFGRNYKAPNVNSMKGAKKNAAAAAAPAKKFFGLF